MRRSKHELESIAQMRKEGYRLLRGKERKAAEDRAIASGFMSKVRVRFPRTREGKKSSKVYFDRFQNNYINFFEKIEK